MYGVKILLKKNQILMHIFWVCLYIFFLKDNKVKASKMLNFFFFSP